MRVFSKMDGFTGSVMDVVAGRRLGEPNLNSGQVSCVQFRTRALEKDIQFAFSTDHLCF